MPLDLSTIALIVGALALAVALLGWWLAATRIRRHNGARQRVAAQGEAEAEALLVALGYRVVDRQVSRAWELWVDGAPQCVRSRADLVVSRAGRRYVAEVKTGRLAPDPTRPATRRQLLEYQLVFPGHGLLVVDMVERRISEVEFPRGPPR